MKWYTQLLTVTIPLLAVLIPGAIAVWELSSVQRRQLEWDRHVRKAGIYAAILKSIDGFYERAEQPREKKENVLAAMRLCELHCPDKVIEAGNAFLETVAVGAKASEEAQRALATFRLRLRRDLQPETELSVKDFRSWGSR